MNDDQLINYIKKQAENKVNPEKIKLALLSSGWLEEKVNEAFMFLNIPLPSSDSLKPSKSKTEITKPFNKKFMFGLIIVALVLVSGGIYAYFNYFLSPERILFKSLKKMNDVEIMQYSGQINFESSDQNLFNNVNAEGILPFDMSTMVGQNNKFSFQVTAVSDISDIYNPRFMLKLASMPNNANTGSDIGAEIRFFGKDKIYASLAEIPASFFGGLDLSLLENKWIEFDLKDFIKNGTSTADNVEYNPKKPPELMFKLEKMKEDLPGLVKSAKKIANEKIEGADAYRYEILFDNDKISQLYFDLSAEGKQLTELQLKSLKEKINKLESIKGEVWVGEKDLLIYKINLVISQKNNAGKTEVSLQIKNHNMPVAIEMPKEAKTLKELMNEILLSVLGGGNMQESVKQDSDGDSLTDTDEIEIWNTNPNHPDTDGDGFWDGDEVRNGFNPNGAGQLQIL